MLLNLVQHNLRLRAVAFGGGEWADELGKHVNNGPLAIAFRPMINVFRGQQSVELELADWKGFEQRAKRRTQNLNLKCSRCVRLTSETWMRNTPRPVDLSTRSLCRKKRETRSSWRYSSARIIQGRISGSLFCHQLWRSLRQIIQAIDQDTP